MENQSQDNWEILIATIIATKMQKNVVIQLQNFAEEEKYKFLNK